MVFGHRLTISQLTGVVELVAQIEWKIGMNGNGLQFDLSNWVSHLIRLSM